MRLNDSVIKNLKATDQSYYVFRSDGTRGTGQLGSKCILLVANLSSIGSN